MKLRKLQISDTYAAPPSYIHSTLGAFGKRGTGKSHAGQLHAEQLLEMGVQVVALDPVGAWWGLRASADGKGPGFPIIVFGGEHGDVPLDPGGGEVLAIAIAEHGFSCVIDLSLMRKGERLRFCADFLETLYRVNREAMHLFVDEADVVAPQRPIEPQQARCLGAADELVRRGRQRGIGCTLISQRPQVVNKDLLSQVDQLLVFRLSHPKDIGAIDAWISDHVDPKLAKEMLASLPTLEVGEGWIWAPDLGVFERIRVNPKTTFDSGRTPKPGERARRPKAMAEVDLKQLGEAMAASAEQAKGNDPKALRATVAELRAELEKVRGSKVKTKVVEKRPIISETLGKKLLFALGSVEQAKKLLLSRMQVGDACMDEVRGMLARALGHESPTTGSARAPATVVHPIALVPREQTRLELESPMPTKSRSKSRSVDFNVAMDELLAEKRSSEAAVGKLSRPQQRILDAIAQLNVMGVGAPTRGQVAWFAETSPKSSGYENNVSSLRTRNLVTYPSGGLLALTTTGSKMASWPARPASNAEFHSMVERALSRPQWAILKALIDLYPVGAGREEVARRAGASASSSGYENNVSALRTLGLIDYPQKGFLVATQTLFPEAKR